MKRLALWSFVTVAALSLLSCPQAALQNPYEGLEAGTFWAQNLATNEYYTVDAALLAEGEKCLVWAARSAGVSVIQGEAIAARYDNKIYPKITGVFGSPVITGRDDVNGEGKLTLLLLDIEDTFNGSGAYTAGYFYSYDLVWPASFEYSNNRAMIYVDTYPSRLCSEESYATIAHELQHCINFTARSLNGYRSMDTWIDEGLSAAAEHIYLGNHNLERISQFTLSKTVQQGNNFFVWGNLPNSLLDEYSTVYLFFQWLRIQSGGTEIYKRIIESPNYDYRAVTGAISGAFAARLGTADGTADWEKTLRSWFAANYLNSPEGLYGYHDQIPTLKVYALGGQTQRLLPGEGVYSIAGKDPGALPSGGGMNIKYAGLRRASPSEEPGVSLNALYPNGRLLTFNSNQQNLRYGETGLLTGEEGETIPQFSAAGRSAGQTGNPGSWNPEGSWIIDARDILGRGNDD
jgi:hypothetical protein